MSKDSKLPPKGVDKSPIDYGKLIDDAMHLIVRKVLLIVEKSGLPGEHHFYISFLTDFPGVMVSDELKARYPEEMTIVIQHQYWELEVKEDHFSIVLSFNHKKHHLTVPYQAVISFADPSMKFGLQFRYAEEYLEKIRAAKEPSLLDAPEVEKTTATISKVPTKTSAKKAKKASNSDADNNDKGLAGSNVISLDSFRKK